MDNINWCININIDSLSERIVNIQNKLNQIETKHIRIDGGYKISKPLTDEQKIKYNLKLNELVSEMEWFKSLKSTLVR